MSLVCARLPFYAKEQPCFEEGQPMTEETLDVIRRRRTIRRFTGDDLSQEEIETLLEMAMCAPNRLNRQPWHF
ncbi:MAG: nitroreductase family protein, partial [Anaerolineae bacterium]